MLRFCVRRLAALCAVLFVIAALGMGVPEGWGGIGQMSARAASGDDPQAGPKCESIDAFMLRVAGADGEMRRLVGPEVGRAQIFYDNYPPVGPAMANADALYVVLIPAGYIALAFERGGRVCESVLVSPQEVPDMTSQIFGRGI